LAISNVLKKAARVQTNDFMRVALEAAEKSAHPATCKSLHDYAAETYKK